MHELQSFLNTKVPIFMWCPTIKQLCVTIIVIASIAFAVILFLNLL